MNAPRSGSACTTGTYLLNERECNEAVGMMRAYEPQVLRATVSKRAVVGMLHASAMDLAAFSDGR
eukprot:8090760-Lingulodinium_polyedra.AAC.1